MSDSEGRRLRVFFELHSDLPRESPGRDDLTQRAFELLPALERPRILDVGCGPGTPTLALARLSDGEIVGLDNHQPYLDRLIRRAEEAGLAHRVTALHGSIFELERFPDSSFDLIWAEGSIYILGFDRALTEWRRLLRPGGHMGIQEVVWLRTETPPADLRAFWNEGYPAIRTIAANLEAIHRAGYEPVGHFATPPDAWWEEYYGPLQVRLRTLQKKYAGDSEALAVLADEQVEIDLYHRYSDWYGTAFFVIRRP
jgi:ubiquinone/menaquinone biosynthesis C-methylase UbiE